MLVELVLHQPLVDSSRCRKGSFQAHVHRQNDGGVGAEAGAATVQHQHSVWRHVKGNAGDGLHNTIVASNHLYAIK